MLYPARRFAACAFAALLALPAAADPVTTVLAGDRWNYPFNGTPGTRASAGIFNSNIPTFGFNKRDGQVVAQWNTTLPPAAQGTSFTVTSARIEVWSLPNAPWDPTQTRVELYAAGFGPDYKELASDPTTATQWLEISPFLGGGPSPTSHRQRDPYPRNFATDAHAEDDLAATPWSIGVHPDFTAPGGTSSAFKITFNLPVGDAKIQQELQADLARGVSSWVVSTNYVSTGQTDTSYPSIYLNGTTPPPAPAAVPALFVEVSPNSSVGDWMCY